MNRREVLKAGIASLAACGGRIGAGEARAADWPTRQVRIVVPFAAGSATDLVPRTIFEQVGKQVGQTFVVENRPGGGTTIGTGRGRKSRSRTATPCWCIPMASSPFRRSRPACRTIR